MTTEEKAKAYDKAIEKIKYVMEHGVSPTLNKEDLQDIFPELQESEGEKTCKWIIMYLNDEFLCADELLKPKLQTAIAWLEKQIEKPQVDGFDAELNVLLKKYEHLPKEELAECLSFYLGVVQGEQPKWTEEDDNILKAITYTVRNSGYSRCIGVTNEEMLAWLESLKQRGGQQ